MSALLRIVVWLLAVALVAAPIVALVQGWAGSERWPLRSLRIDGELQQVDAVQVQAAVLPHAQRGFFAVRLDDVQAAVARLPWVESVEVARQWPDVLEVHVTEHVPFARWGEDRLLSTHGRLFPVGDAGVPAHLPLLDGPDAAVSDVVALYNDASTRFGALGLVVESLRQDARGSWSLRLSGGTDVVIGSSEARLRLQRFVRILPQLLAARPQVLERADLRYTNGFALRWGSEERQRPAPDALDRDAPPAADAEASPAAAARPATVHPLSPLARSHALPALSRLLPA